MIAQVTNHLWQSTVFAFAVAAAAFLLRRNRAHVRYALWCAASAKFIVPFSLLVSLGAFLPLRTTQPSARPSAPPAFSVAVGQLAQPFQVVTPLRDQAPASGFSWTLAVFAIWLCVCAAIVVARLRAWRRVRRAVQQSVQMPVSVGHSLDVRMSAATLEPGVVGMWRPILLLPNRIIESLTPRQFETVVAHEICHARRRDNLIAAIHMAVEAACWFHPLVWWIGSRMLAERERACDEAVLEQGLDPRDYADAILNVCKLCVESPIACVSGVTGSNLKRRITDIMTGRTGATLTRARKAALAVAGMAALVAPVAMGSAMAPLRAQTSAAPLKFDVVSVKPCQQEGGDDNKVSPGYIHVQCHTLLQLIQAAYLVYANGHINSPLRSLTTAIDGAPDWIKYDAYTIEAKTNTPQPVAMMRGPMLQTVLEDRFKLKIHRETRIGPVYELTAAKGGSKLTPFKDGSCVNLDWTNGPPAPLAPGQRQCQAGMHMDSGKVVWDAEGFTLDQFAARIRPDGRPVINKTGIDGRVNFHLEYQAGEVGADSAAPSIFTALKEQLGLELHAAKGPRDFLVIDHVERPSAGG